MESPQTTSGQWDHKIFPATRQGDEYVCWMASKFSPNGLYLFYVYNACIWFCKYDSFIWYSYLQTALHLFHQQHVLASTGTISNISPRSVNVIWYVTRHKYISAYTCMVRWRQNKQVWLTNAGIEREVMRGGVVDTRCTWTEKNQRWILSYNLMTKIIVRRAKHCMVWSTYMEYQ